jgi:hypothetical protein
VLVANYAEAPQDCKGKSSFLKIPDGFSSTVQASFPSGRADGPRRRRRRRVLPAVRLGHARNGLLRYRLLSGTNVNSLKFSLQKMEKFNSKCRHSMTQIDLAKGFVLKQKQFVTENWRQCPKIVFIK